VRIVKIFFERGDFVNDPIVKPAEKDLGGVEEPQPIGVQMTERLWGTGEMERIF
jgi:hypothetical protein